MLWGSPKPIQGLPRKSKNLVSLWYNDSQVSETGCRGQHNLKFLLAWESSSCGAKQQVTRSYCQHEKDMAMRSLSKDCTLGTSQLGFSGIPCRDKHLKLKSLIPGTLAPGTFGRNPKIPCFPPAVATPVSIAAGSGLFPASPQAIMQHSPQHMVHTGLSMQECFDFMFPFGIH